MTILILFLAVATALAIGAVRLALHDGPGPQRPPASHVEDPRFRSPAMRGLVPNPDTFRSPGTSH